jgi:hypothetical protein
VCFLHFLIFKAFTVVIPLLNFAAFQTMSQICLGCTTVLSAGIVQTHSFEVQAGLVSPFLLAASSRKSKAVT